MRVAGVENDIGGVANQVRAVNLSGQILRDNRCGLQNLFIYALLLKRETESDLKI